jgi:Tol biopolymer transport system component
VHGSLLLAAGLAVLLAGCGGGGGGDGTVAGTAEKPSLVGSIRVTVDFSGSNFDQSEPRLVLDATTTRTGIASAVTFNNIAPGNHEISLEGLHARCVRTGAASQTVAVTAGQTAEVRYAVNCRDVDQLAVLVPQGTDVAGSQYGVLQIVDVDGQRQHEVFTQQAGVAIPAWSRDGRRLAFRYSDAPATSPESLWTVNADGTQLRKIWTTENISTFVPTDIKWSPDGTRLAVVVTGGGQSPTSVPTRLLLMDANGANVTEVTLVNGSASSTWAPDGSRLAASFNKLRDYDPGPDDGLYIVNGSGALGQKLSPATTVPQWSPDGSLILYWFGGLFTIHPDGTGLRELDACPDGCANGSWSPDGSRIAVISASDIRIIDTDAQLLGTPFAVASAGNIRWSPSATYLAWITESRTVTVAETDGTNMRVIAELPTANSRGMFQYDTPAWRP